MKLLHSNTPYTFLGVENRWEKSKIAVLPVPYDSTASYGTGQRWGPNAIIQASRQLEVYDIEFRADFSQELGFFTLDELMCSKKGPEDVINAVRESIAAILDEGRFPLMLGGEHSITIGAVQAMSQKYNDFWVLHLDAHADMRQSYENSKYSHACTMARCREIASAVSVGVRSYSQEEAKEVEEKYKELIFDASALTKERIGKIISKIKSKEVYITIDIDAFDPSVMPAVGTPEPGGLLWNEVLLLLKEVGKRKKIVGADIVELAPIAGQAASDFACAKLAYKLAGYALYKK
jgi:agmatinase